MPETRSPSSLSRRRLLSLGATAAAGVALGACQQDGPDGTAGTAGGTDGPAPGAPGSVATTADLPAAEPVNLSAADFADLPCCTLQPQQTAGPFPTIGELVRRDITDGQPGHPMQLGLRVVDADGAPLAGVAVEVWHTDATGDYSQYVDGGTGKDEGEGTTFCRGLQVSDADGIVEFQSLYPGWYSGRALHVHLRATVDGTDVLVTQLYFDDAYSEAVLATGAYADNGPPDVSTSEDRFAAGFRTNGTLLTTTSAATPGGDGTRALAVLGLGV